MSSNAPLATLKRRGELAARLDIGMNRFNREKFVWRFEMATVRALQVLIMLSVLVATMILFVLFAEGIYTHIKDIQSVTSLLPLMQNVFAGVLIVLLGLELAETMKAYSARHEIRVEVILIVAIVAVGRHMIQVDFDHAPGVQIIGLSALMLSLTGGYFLVRKAHAQLPSPNSDVVPPEHLPKDDSRETILAP